MGKNLEYDSERNTARYTMQIAVSISNWAKETISIKKVVTYCYARSNIKMRNIDKSSSGDYILKKN